MSDHLFGRYDPSEIRAQITDHPLAAIGLALLAGLVAASNRGRSSHWVRRQIAEMTTGFASTLLLAVANEGVRTWKAKRRPTVFH